MHAARKDADTHFAFTDNSSPAPEKAKSLQREKGMGLYSTHYQIEDDVPKSSQDKDAPPHEVSRATRTDMAQNWGHGTPPKDKKIYKTAGDGMGGRKVAGGRGWGIGDDSDIEDDSANVPSRARGRPQQAQAGAAGF